MPMNINPETLYWEHDIILYFGLTFNVLQRARKAGQLEYREVSRGKRIYTGAALLAWLGGKGDGGKGGAR